MKERMLKHVGSLSGVGPGRWYFDYGADKIYFADDPTGKTVETSVSAFAFRGGGNTVTISGLIIEKYASPPQHIKRRYGHMTLRNWVDMYWALSKRQEGQTMAEYGVILAVITVGVIAAITALALAVSGKLTSVTTILNKVV